MARRVGLTRETVLATAVKLAEHESPGAVTLAAVADRLGIRSPSLYAHFENLASLHRSISLRAAAELGQQLQAARQGQRGGLALAAVARAYLRFARAHPGWYEILHATPPDNRDHELYRALAGLVMPLVESLSEMGAPPAELIHQTRLVRSALHGFVSLERSNGFGPPVGFDQSFERLVALLVSGISAGRAGQSG